MAGRHNNRGVRDAAVCGGAVRGQEPRVGRLSTWQQGILLASGGDEGKDCKLEH